MSETRKSWLSIALLWLFLLVLAASRPLTLPDEGRYAEIGRWMLLSGDWLTPRLNGLPFFHKPPLLHWLQAITLQGFGETPWSARLVPAAHAGLMLVAMYLAARRMADEATARRAVWMLGGSLTFLYGGQFVNHDMMVATWIGVAIWCFAAAIVSEGATRQWLALAGFAACAMGVLSKGLIGLVLPGLVLFVWLFVARLWRHVPRLPWLSGILLLLVLALPWFVLVERVHPGVFDYLIIGQHFRRYTGDTFNNQWPVWSYLAVMLVLLFPWAFLVLADALQALWRRRVPVRRAPSPWPALLWVWLIAITVFFTIPKSKLVGYILPVMPPLALLAALFWQSRWGRSARASKVFVLLCALNLGIGVLASKEAERQSLLGGNSDVAQVLSCRMSPQDRVLVAEGYPYGLAFEAHLQQPLIVVSDWVRARKVIGDGWRSELFEGADFDAQAGQVLQPLQVLTQTPPAGRWLVTPKGAFAADALGAWRKTYEGRASTLWESVAYPAESSAAAQSQNAACRNLPTGSADELGWWARLRSAAP